MMRNICVLLPNKEKYYFIKVLFYNTIFLYNNVDVVVNISMCYWCNKLLFVLHFSRSSHVLPS